MIPIFYLTNTGIAANLFDVGCHLLWLDRIGVIRIYSNPCFYSGVEAWPVDHSEAVPSVLRSSYFTATCFVFKIQQVTAGVVILLLSYIIYEKVFRYCSSRTLFPATVVQDATIDIDVIHVYRLVPDGSA